MKQNNPQSIGFPTSYREEKIDKTIYRVTGVHKGEISLKDALEDLAVKRVLREAFAESNKI